MEWKVYKMILRPSVIGGLEMVDLEVAELKMLKFSLCDKDGQERRKS